MRNAWKIHRLRKYARKKFKRSDPLAVLYWTYWHKLYGDHQPLWGEVE